MGKRASITSLMERVERLEAELARERHAGPNPQPIAANGAVSSRVSRRAVLVKGAMAGAAGLTAIALTRPRDAEAAYALQGDADNLAHAPTSMTAQSSYPFNSYVFRADASPTNNSTQNIDGLEGQGAGGANGVRGWGGPVNGAGVYAQGGTATGTTSGGAGVVAIAGGTTAQGLAAGQGLNATGSFGGPGVYATGGDGVVAKAAGTANGAGVRASGNGVGPGVLAFGGTASGIEAYGGSPDGIGLVAGGAGRESGVFARGGTTDGTGVTAIGSGTYGIGVVGQGAAQGIGGYFAGGLAQIHVIPAAAAGPPTTNPHQQGDLWFDSREVLWMCIANGTPGTFVPMQFGGLNNALFTAVSTSQYTLTNSDGSVWHDVDATNLSLIITPGFNCQAILTANADLWTSVAGFNQDIGIAISGGAYGAGQLVAWKESGGSAGTFSPNAAFVETVKPLVGGIAYTIKLQWKANKPGSSTIWIGAGSTPTFSPTRLTALLVVS